MSKVLLISYRPPQLIGDAKIEAAHYRTWQFLEPLIQDGHTIHLCIGISGEDIADLPIPTAWNGQVTYKSIKFGQRGWIAQLQSEHDKFNPDCVIAVNFSHCLYATRLQTERPVWMDIYGEMLTIMQAAFYRAQSNRGLDTSIGFMQQVLCRGDVFSGCGDAQKHMMVGELAMVGRLNRYTFGYEFTRTILPGSPTALENPKQPAGIPLLQQQCDIKPTDFVVLWCGGYNTWADVDTLFAGLECAMACNPTIQYVSVGASTYEGPDNVYNHFLKLIKGSKHHHRYHMLGWRPWTEIPSYYRDSHIGLNVDSLHYETIYGTRTRLVEMMAAGLPVITTLGSELSYLLEKENIGLTYQVGDWQALGKQLLHISQNPDLQQKMAQQAHEYATTTLSFYETTKPLRTWVQAPTIAPDRARHSRAERRKNTLHKMRARMRHLIWHFTGEDK